MMEISLKEDKVLKKVLRRWRRKKIIPTQIYFQELELAGEIELNSQKESLLKLNKSDSSAISFQDSDQLLLEIIWPHFKTQYHTRIIKVIDNHTYQIEEPSEMKLFSKRQDYRYFIETDQNLRVILNDQSEQELTVVNISIGGLAVLSQKKLAAVGEEITNLMLYLGNHQLAIDARVCYITREGSFYKTGLSFDNDKWPLFSEIIHPLLQQFYPNLKLFGDFSLDSIYEIYYKSGYLRLRNETEMLANFNRVMETTVKVQDYLQYCLNVVYYKNKILLAASNLRIYNRTFLGHHLAAIPEAIFDTKAKKDYYLSIYDFIINHPYLNYHLAYFNQHSSWQQEMLKGFADVINNPRIFFYDTLSYFEFAVEDLTNLEVSSEYQCQQLDDATEFIKYAAENLPEIENNCYGYNESEFSLQETKIFYELFNCVLNRTLIGIYQGERVVAYLIVEVFSKSLNFFDFIDMCRFHIVDQNIDFAKVLPVIFKDVSKIFKKYGKKRLNLFLKATDLSEKLENVILTFNPLKVFSAGRVIIDKKGLITYQSLMKLFL